MFPELFEAASSTRAPLPCRVFPQRAWHHPLRHTSIVIFIVSFFGKTAAFVVLGHVFLEKIYGYIYIRIFFQGGGILSPYLSPARS